MGSATGTAAALAGIQDFNFARNIDFLSRAGATGFRLTSQLDAGVVQALVDDTPLPDRTIRLVNLKVQANTPDPIVFSRQGGDRIAFSARGSVLAGMGVYTKASDLVRDLPEDQFILPGLDFNLADGDVLGALRWGFDAAVKANGSMALGAVGAATLKAEASGEGLFAVIRRLPKTTGARTLLQTVGDSWILPRQVRSIDNVEPGTWLLAEVMGSVGVTLGATLGYDFNWVREVGLGQLRGDIGLRLQLGLSAAIGFRAAGKCVVVVSRESADKVLRLRVLRVKSKQFDFGLNAAADVKAIDTLLPRKADDLVKAIFGLHSEQLLTGIAVIQKWTDPSKPLSELLATGGVDGAEALIARMAGVSVADLAKRFDQVQSTAVSFIKRWQEIPHAVSTVVMSVATDTGLLEQVRALATELATVEKTGLEQLLNDRLGGIDFFSTPAGMLLEAMGGGAVLNLLQMPLAGVRKLAQSILAILDGGNLEEVLKRFQAHLEDSLNLTRVIDTVTKTDFKALDGLLRKRLADFLGKDTLDFTDIDRVRSAINVVLARRQEFYEKALEAIHRTYGFDLAFAFQKASEDQAMLDATFDFSQDSANVQTFFERALAGDFDFIFTNHHPRVKLKLAELSHGVKRQTHTDVTLPFLSVSMDHTNDSLATARVEEQDGRVVAYRLETSDKVANNQRTSILALSMAMSAQGFESGDQVRVHQNELELTYSSVFVKRDMTRQHLEANLEPVASTYFPTKLAMLDDYIDFIDRRTEEEIPNTRTTFGNGLISLQVALPEEAAMIAGAAWLNLSADKKHPAYGDISKAIQTKLKELIPAIYFTEPERYHNLLPAYVLLAYCSFPARADNTNYPHWDTASKAQVQAMLNRAETLTQMKAFLRAAQVTLAGTGDAKLFRPADAQNILGNLQADGAQLNGLLFTEAEIIEHAYEAGLNMASFRKKGGKPTEAVVALSEFGAKLTTAFNGDLVNMYVGDGVRALGTELFLAATRAIVPKGKDRDALETTNSLLTIEFMKPGLTFDAAAVKAKGRLPADQVAVSESVVEIA